MFPLILTWFFGSALETPVATCQELKQRSPPRRENCTRPAPQQEAARSCARMCVLCYTAHAVYGTHGTHGLRHRWSTRCLAHVMYSMCSTHGTRDIRHTGCTSYMAQTVHMVHSARARPTQWHFSVPLSQSKAVGWRKSSNGLVM